MQRNIFIDTDNEIFIKKGQRKLTQIKKHSLESFNSFREREIRSEMILMKMHSCCTKAGVFWRVGKETRTLGKLPIVLFSWQANKESGIITTCRLESLIHTVKKLSSCRMF